MATRLSLPTTFFLITAAVFLFGIAIASATESKETPEERPMNFVLVRNGNCQESCVEWISAEGEITTDTPRRFKKLLKDLDGRRLPVVFQSHGGDVDAALSIGRMIRAAGLDTGVGRTQLNGCPMLDPRCTEKMIKNGWSEGEVHAGGAYCFSACPFALAGGEIRAAAANAYVGVHQLTNGPIHQGTGRRRLDVISTKSDPELNQKLAIYLDEMGVSSKDVFAMMGLATPKGIYYVQSAEALKSHVITRVFLSTDEPGFVVRGTSVKTSAMPNEF